MDEKQPEKDNTLKDNEKDNTLKDNEKDNTLKDKNGVQLPSGPPEFYTSTRGFLPILYAGLGAWVLSSLA